MPKRRKKPRFKTSFPLQRDKKGKVTPVEGVTGPFADTVKEKEKFEKAEKDYSRKERERGEKFRSGVKKFVKKILSGATNKAMRKRARDLEKTIYPNRFIKRK